MTTVLSVTQSIAPEFAMPPIADVPIESVLKSGYLTIQQVSERTGQRRDSIRRLIKRGKLDAIRPLPRLLLVKETSLTHYLKTKHPGGAPPGPRKPSK